jgi:NAD(P)-dependent dehydrogenase (short-subunit alcohol dehydrogenase family)
MACLLAHKRCLLVGGTGGLGFAAARRFLEEGAILNLASVSDRALTGTFRYLRIHGGERCYHDHQPANRRSLCLPWYPPAPLANRSRGQ